MFEGRMVHPITGLSEAYHFFLQAQAVDPENATSAII
jgi:hypothetical protein